MSVPFAFNVEGEAFTLPPQAAAWRVKRLRGPGESGAPELVYNSDGLPLFLSLDTTTEELRRAVKGELGKYRFDPVDDQNRVIKGAEAGYVLLRAPEPVTSPTTVVAPVASSAPSTTVSFAIPDSPNSNAVVMEALRQTTDLARSNGDLARTIVEKFPRMLEAAAVLIAAADGAGMPARAQRVEHPQGDQEDEEDEGDEEEDDAEAPTDGRAKAAPTGPRVDLLALAQLLPMFMTMLTKGNGKTSGLADLLDAIKAFATGGTGKTAHKPGSAAPAPDATTAHKPGPATPMPETKTHKAATSPDRAAGVSAAAAAEEPAPPQEREAAAPSLSPEEMAHFMAIQAALTPDEAALARAAAGELSPTELQAWISELAAMSVADAVARIRKLLTPSKMITPSQEPAS